MNFFPSRERYFIDMSREVNAYRRSCDVKEVRKFEARKKKIMLREDLAVKQRKTTKP